MERMTLPSIENVQAYVFDRLPRLNVGVSFRCFKSDPDTVTFQLADRSLPANGRVLQFVAIFWMLSESEAKETLDAVIKHLTEQGKAMGAYFARPEEVSKELPAGEPDHAIYNKESIDKALDYAMGPPPSRASSAIFEEIIHKLSEISSMIGKLKGP